MKNILLFWGSIIMSSSLLAQGDNCSNPKPVNLICPTTVSFTGETTTGFTNDVNSWGAYTYAGKDRVYEVTVPPGSVRILVSITSPTGFLSVISTNNICNGASQFRTSVYYSMHNISIPVSGTGPYYIWIDQSDAVDITYNIAFGVITSTTPNTKGSWTIADNCINPITKPGLEISYNGSRQNIPLYYSPLYTQGQVCATFYYKNLTGVEGVKQFVFTHGPHLFGFAPSVTSMPGFYNAGTWNAVSIGNQVIWTFTDAAGTGRGDFTGTPNNCLAYKFCFNMTPQSNTPAGTLIKGFAYSDAFGSIKDVGCCPSPFNCSATATASGSAIGFAFDDPPLPVVLTDFYLKKESGFNILHWQTSSEYNSKSFELERSESGDTYSVIASVDAAGESHQPISYSWKVEHPSSQSYYRLKQIDKDGSFHYSKTIFTKMDEQELVLRIYPSPANEFLSIECSEAMNAIRIHDVLGNLILSLEGEDRQKNTYSISTLSKGIYVLSIQLRDQVITRKIVIGNN